MFGFLVDFKYDTNQPERIEQILRNARQRDDVLNKEEEKARVEALKECIFGPKYWLRAHP